MSANALFKIRDLSAGLVVFLVALPLCLGIAVASGAPVAAGLLSGIVGGIIVGAISGSHTSVSGPAAGLTAVIASQITTLGSFEAFLPALIIAGLLQIGMGVVRLGFIAGFFPSSIIKGLLAAIGILLILKQLPHLVGWDSDAIGDMAFWQHDHQNTFSELWHIPYHFHNGAALIGFLSIGILFFWDKSAWLQKTKIPSPLVVVGISVLLSSLLSSFFGDEWQIGAEHLVQVPSSDGMLLGFLTRPDFSQFLSSGVYVAGLTIALVASLETLLNLEAVDKLDPKKRISPPNLELIAQGIGNTLLGFLGGLPVTSVVIRSSVNINAGGQTRFAAIFHGVLLCFCAILLPFALNLIPLSCLAAILVVTGFKLVHPKVFKQMWFLGMSQWVPFLVTLVAILLTDLLVGVIIGLAMSLVFIFRSNVRSPLQLIEENHLGGKVYRLLLANQVSFLNRASLFRTLNAIPEGEHILIDASNTDYMDKDILDSIRDFKQETSLARGVSLSLLGFPPDSGLENSIHFAVHSTPELQKAITPHQVLRILEEGNRRALLGKRLYRNFERQIQATSNGQFPIGVVLSCMDSRASTELIFDLGIGDIFSVRMAGHVISEKVLGSLEYACGVAGAKLILIKGHTRCGAINSAIDTYEQSQKGTDSFKSGSHLGSIVSDLHGVIKRYAEDIPKAGTPERDRFADQISRENVIECIRLIQERSQSIRQLLVEEKIAIAGCLYDVKSGRIEVVKVVG